MELFFSSGQADHLFSNFSSLSQLLTYKGQLAVVLSAHLGSEGQCPADCPLPLPQGGDLRAEDTQMS